jgi:hypothetical protein
VQVTQKLHEEVMHQLLQVLGRGSEKGGTKTENDRRRLKNEDRQEAVTENARVFPSICRYIYLYLHFCSKLHNEGGRESAEDSLGEGIQGEDT